jgi:hypothetical protein
MKLGITLATAFTLLFSSAPAWAERIRLDCPYRGSGAMLFDRPMRDGSVSLLVDEASGISFIWGDGDWRKIIVAEISHARILLKNPGFIYDISRTNGTISINWEEAGHFIPVGKGTCTRVAEAPRRF